MDGLQAYTAAPKLLVIGLAAVLPALLHTCVRVFAWEHAYVRGPELGPGLGALLPACVLGAGMFAYLVWHSMLGCAYAPAAEQKPGGEGPEAAEGVEGLCVGEPMLRPDGDREWGAMLHAFTRGRPPLVGSPRVAPAQPVAGLAGLEEAGSWGTDAQGGSTGDTGSGSTGGTGSGSGGVDRAASLGEAPMEQPQEQLQQPWAGQQPLPPQQQQPLQQPSTELQGVPWADQQFLLLQQQAPWVDPGYMQHQLQQQQQQQHAPFADQQFLQQQQQQQQLPWADPQSLQEQLQLPSSEQQAQFWGQLPMQGNPQVSPFAIPAVQGMASAGPQTQTLQTAWQGLEQQQQQQQQMGSSGLSSLGQLAPLPPELLQQAAAGTGATMPQLPLGMQPAPPPAPAAPQPPPAAPLPPGAAPSAACPPGPLCGHDTAQPPRTHALPPLRPHRQQARLTPAPACDDVGCEVQPACGIASPASSLMQPGQARASHVEGGSHSGLPLGEGVWMWGARGATTTVRGQECGGAQGGAQGLQERACCTGTRMGAGARSCSAGRSRSDGGNSSSSSECSSSCEGGSSSESGSSSDSSGSGGSSRSSNRGAPLWRALEQAGLQGCGQGIVAYSKGGRQSAAATLFESTPAAPSTPLAAPRPAQAVAAACPVPAAHPVQLPLRPMAVPVAEALEAWGGWDGGASARAGHASGGYTPVMQFSSLADSVPHCTRHAPCLSVPAALAEAEEDGVGEGEGAGQANPHSLGHKRKHKRKHRHRQEREEAQGQLQQGQEQQWLGEGEGQQGSSGRHKARASKVCVCV